MGADFLSAVQRNFLLRSPICQAVHWMLCTQEVSPICVIVRVIAPTRSSSSTANLLNSTLVDKPETKVYWTLSGTFVWGPGLNRQPISVAIHSSTYIAACGSSSFFKGMSMKEKEMGVCQVLWWGGIIGKIFVVFDVVFNETSKGKHSGIIRSYGEGRKKSKTMRKTIQKMPAFSTIN